MGCLGLLLTYYRGTRGTAGASKPEKISGQAARFPGNCLFSGRRQRLSLLIAAAFVETRGPYSVGMPRA